ncbi:MAG: hypothetical protein ACR2NM_11870 [Bythopirellula sp.]
MNKTELVIKLLAFMAAFAFLSAAQGETLYNQNLLFNAFPDAAPKARFDKSYYDINEELLVKFRAGGTAIVDMTYDTGLVANSPLFRPAAIALDGTPESRGRGRFQLTGTSTLVTFEAAAESLPGKPRAYSNLDFVDDVNLIQSSGSKVRLRDAFGVFSLASNYDLVGGQTFTTFGDNRTLPFSLVNDGTPAGAVFQRQAQVRLTRLYQHGWNTSCAIEDPTNEDFVLPTPSAATDPNRNIRLQRYPDFITRLQWVRPSGDENEIDRFNLAGLCRAVGFEDVTNDEDFVYGWGVSANTRFRVRYDNNVQLGAVVGEGLGRYLFGFGSSLSTARTAAGPDLANELAPVKHVGSYIGYQHFFSDRLGGNVAYGYAQADTTAAMTGVARRSQNAWINLILEVNKSFHVGLEYQYGILEVTEGTQGDNSRIQMTMTLR